MIGEFDVIDGANASPADVIEGRARWCVVQADSVWALGGFPDLCIDHVIMDPPYSRHVHTRQRRQSMPDAHTAPSRRIREHDLGFDHLTPAVRRALAVECARLTRRWVLAFSDFESVWKLRLAFEAAGLRHWRVGCWDKCETGAPQFNGLGPAQWGEAIEIAHSRAAMRWNGGGARAVWRHLVEIARGGSGIKPKIQKAERNSTRKPRSLMVELVGDFTEPDEFVLDPFCGDSTTGVACIQLGRRYIGIDRRASAVATSRQRLAETHEGLVIAKWRPKQTSLF